MIRSGNVTIMTTDFARAIRFYTEVLGFKVASRVGEEWAEVEIQGLTVGIHPARSGSSKAAPEALSIGLEVAALEDAMNVLTARGVLFRGEPVDDDMVRLAFFSDPDGTPLYLCEVKHP